MGVRAPEPSVPSARLTCICSTRLAGKRFPSPSPRPTSWERPEGALLERAGRPPGPLCSRGCCPLPCRMGARGRIELGHHLSKCVRGKAGPAAAGDRGLHGPRACAGSLHLLGGFRPAAGSGSQKWCSWLCVAAGPCGPGRPHRPAGGKRCSRRRQRRAGSRQPPLDQRVRACVVWGPDVVPHA